MYFETTNIFNDDSSKSDSLNILKNITQIDIENKINKKQKTRCNMCNIKVNITNSITCKCNQLLCYKHRYFNEHNCTFDHKTADREQLAKINQKVENSKIDKI